MLTGNTKEVCYCIWGNIPINFGASFYIGLIMVPSSTFSVGHLDLICPVAVCRLFSCPCMNMFEIVDQRWCAGAPD